MIPQFGLYCGQDSGSYRDDFTSVRIVALKRDAFRFPFLGVKWGGTIAIVLTQGERTP